MKIIILVLASLLVMTNAIQLDQSEERRRHHHSCNWIMRKAHKIFHHMDTDKSGKVYFKEYYAYKLKYHYRKNWWRWAHKTKKYWSRSFMRTYRKEFHRWNVRNRLMQKQKFHRKFHKWYFTWPTLRKIEERRFHCKRKHHKKSRK